MVAYDDLGTAFQVAVLRQATGFGLTLGLWQLYRRWPAAQFQLAPHVWKILLGCAVVTGIDYLLMGLSRHMLALPPVDDAVLRGAAILRFAVFVAWSVLYFGIRQELESRETELRLAQAEAANREAELQLLRAQMNPHFIFNALNTIIAESEGNAAAIETTHAVADYLRYSLSQRAHLAPLGRELDAMTNYLRVEHTHHGEQRLVWEINATPAARAAYAPTAFVQPLIENALKYGLRTSALPLQLRVSAAVSGKELSVVVENSGEWIVPSPEGESGDSTGIGLTNLRRRLVLLCGEHARLNVTTPAGMVRIEVRLPLSEPSSVEQLQAE